MPKFVLTKKYFNGERLYNKGDIVNFKEGMAPPKGSVPYEKPKGDEEEEDAEAKLLREEAERAAKLKDKKEVALSELQPKPAKELT